MHLHNRKMTIVLTKLLTTVKRAKGMISFDFRSGEGEIDLSVPDTEHSKIEPLLGELNAALTEEGVEVDYKDTRKRSSH